MACWTFANVRVLWDLFKLPLEQWPLSHGVMISSAATREFLKRRDEQYGRVKASQLYGLLVEYSDGGGMDAIPEEGLRRPVGPAGEPCEFMSAPGEKVSVIRARNGSASLKVV